MVGYANVRVSAGYNFLVNPFITGSNNINAVLSSGSSLLNGAQVWLWNGTNQSFEAPATYSQGVGWNPDIQLPPGRGFVLAITAPLPQFPIVMFQGVIPMGELSNLILGSNRLSLVGSLVPQSTSLAGLEYPGVDGELAYLWNPTNQAFIDASTFFSGYGWSGAAGSSGPILPIAHAVFVQRPGPDTNWTRRFFISMARTAGASSRTDSELAITSIVIEKSDIKLLVMVPAGAAYDLWFSRDGTTWKSVATKQASPVWRGTYPGGTHGYYRAVKSAR
ncbi:MAG: hypothetical protein KIS67_14700 [Verrucomicrobiae bacterium]|nr:hypothetical protein [Verrucomicrobiae bacterium]